MKKYRKYPYKEKAESGVWYAFFRDANNRKHEKSLRTRNDVVADKKFVQLLEQVDKGILGFSLKPQNLPLGEAIARYLAEGTRRLAESSVQRHRESLENHVAPHFRSISLKAIEPKDIAGYIRKRENADAAPNTIYKELASLSAVFKFHIRDGSLLYNPVLAVEKPRLKVLRPNYAPTSAELLKIFNALAPHARRFFLFLCTASR